MNVFDVPDHDPLPEPVVEEFKQGFVDALNPECSFYKLTIRLPLEKRLVIAECFLSGRLLYTKALPIMHLTTFENLSRFAEWERADKIVIAVYRELPNRNQIYRTLRCLGFKQVDPKVQKELCKVPAVLFWLDL
ncbi:unnamed protein product [Blepharisma stoltei]|uniref:Uncharacterized protein n=1 Tax=Blepharisma stoltei TaxID=1481888 RepID=A0AAU9KD43_9CILI|nr:unnamed protein product [Blepharisma stoltei]